MIDVCYCVSCDECVNVYRDKDGDVVYLSSAAEIEDEASRHGWVADGELHRCPSCQDNPPENKRGFPE